MGVERARSVCTGDRSDLCYDKTAKYTGVLQVAILYIYRAVKDKKIFLSFRDASHQTSCCMYVCMMYENC